MIPLWTMTAAAQFIPGLNAGTVIRYGSILKDAATGRIVGHLQETGLLQGALSTVAPLSPPPLNMLFYGLQAVTAASSVTGNVQMMRLQASVNQLQESMGVVQALSAATLASSVVGIGATVASTIILMRRIEKVSGKVDRLGEKLDALPELLRKEDLKKTLRQVRQSLDRLAEVESRPASGASVVAREEERLDDAVDGLSAGLGEFASCRMIDPATLRTVAAGLMVAAEGVALARLRSDGPGAARMGAERHYKRFEDALGRVPPDLLRAKLAPQEDDGTLRGLVSDLREARARLATRPAFHARLMAGDFAPNAVIEAARTEQGQPFLILPT